MLKWSSSVNAGRRESGVRRENADRRESGVHRENADRRESVRRETADRRATVRREIIRTDIIAVKTTGHSAAETERGETDQMAAIKRISKTADRLIRNARILRKAIATITEAIRIAAGNLIPEDWTAKLTNLIRNPHR